MRLDTHDSCLLISILYYTIVVDGEPTDVQASPSIEFHLVKPDELLYWPTLFETRLMRGGNRMDDEKDTKVRFETLSAEKIPFGKNNFLEVARKKAITEEGDSEFISVSRGYYLPDGSEKYKKSITIPDDPNIKAFVTEKINKL